MTETFADHFSSRAEAYAKFRPTYPAALYDAVVGLCPRTTLAVDCATGSGQAAHALAGFFDAVIATDASAEQISHATPHAKVRFHCTPAEDLRIVAKGTANLVTVAAGVHWFDRERFYAEIARILSPGGVIAVWTYGPDAHVCPAVDAIIEHVANDLTAADWPPQTELVRARYATLDFPFVEVDGMNDFGCTLSWSLDDVCGVIRTWSGVIRYEQRTGDDVIDRIRPALERAWPVNNFGPTPVRIPLGLRVGRARPI